ncbi:hypothetical protein BUALT_Bualt10G0070000 [Buddleja alternifolia]|uniref:Sulfotransferase n=1 Tax=Buddleja alternifolia TaxID=168488 RepID=A0AAV6WVV7_9LAMI|nr:hypothetical protein BUALT_Bualt10G0070000 [Buddleja alternifolia]
MEKKADSKCSSAQVQDPKDESQELLQTLEQQLVWNSSWFVKYDGFWFPVRLFKAILSTRKYFKAKETDIILSTMPKSGTTWLKALTFCIVNRDVYIIDENPLLTATPHTVVPFFEYNTYAEQENPDLEHIPSPRIFSTHISFNVLPNSIRESNCRIIYICKNPLDQFISHWLFMLEMKIGKDAKPLAMDEAFDMFCQGNHPFGPFWAHMLGYWNAHLNSPQNVLFLKYEDLKEDITLSIKKIAEFLGFPFSLDEQKQGAIQQISRFCSFEHLSTLEVNKNGNFLGMVKNSSFFRKGEVGD